MEGVKLTVAMLIAVLLQWAYSYLTYKRGARIITDVAPVAQPAAPAVETKM